MGGLSICWSFFNSITVDQVSCIVKYANSLNSSNTLLSRSCLLQLKKIPCPSFIVLTCTQLNWVKVNITNSSRFCLNVNCLHYNTFMTIIGRLGAKKVKMLIKSLFSLKMSNIVERKFMFSFISSLDYNESQDHKRKQKLIWLINFSTKEKLFEAIVLKDSYKIHSHLVLWCE